MRKNIINILKYIVVFLFIIISFYFMIRVYKLNILKTLYLSILYMIVLLVCVLFVIKILSKKSKLVTKIIVSIIAIIFSTIYLIGLKYINTTITFVSNMTSINYETQNYSVLVLKDSSYNNIEDLKNKKIGFLTSNINLDTTINTLNKKIKIKSKEYEDIGTLIAAIYDNKIDALVIDDSYIELLEENEVEFFNESKVIYNYDVKVETKDTRRRVNLNKEPSILYISGSDSRGSISATARSDVNIVVVVNPKTNKILLVSIPRDYYVQLHGTTGVKDKLTHAGVYGIEKSITTIEDLLDIDINYYTKVGFTTVINVVDVIDGVEINSDQDLRPDANRSCIIKKGKQIVDGKCALAYARERHAYLSGDRHRGENQQEVLTAIIKKLSNPKYLVKYNKILKAVDGSFNTDLTYNDITEVVKYQLNELKSWKIESISLDGTGASMPTYSMGSMKLYVMEPDMNTVNKAKEKIKEYLKGE